MAAGLCLQDGSTAIEHKSIWNNMIVARGMLLNIAKSSVGQVDKYGTKVQKGDWHREWHNTKE